MSTDIQVGDRFEITVEVVSGGGDVDGEYRVRTSRGWVTYATAMFLADGRRLPRAIRVGDTVAPRHPPTNDGPWSVVAIHDEWAWCRNPHSDSGWLFRLSDLTPIPGDEK